MDMNSKERVLKAVAHQPTDRVPVDYWSRTDVTNKLIAYLGLKSAEELYIRLGIDLRTIPLGMHDPAFEAKTTGILGGFSESCGGKYIIDADGRFEDVWGVVRRLGSNQLYDQWISGPFVATDDLDSFAWPDLNSFDSVETVQTIVKSYHNRFALMGKVSLPFKLAWHMRGFENFLCDMIGDPDFAKSLLERVAIYQREKGLRFIRAGVDIVGIVGDLGMQDRLMVNPKAWRQIEKPIIAEMIKAFKAENPHILIYFHSDGNILEILPDLIEIGVNIINPIQPECMDPVMVKEKYGEQITMHGTISIQRTLPNGSRADVQHEVCERIKTCGKNGGLIICPSNLFQNDTPLENIIAMYDAAVYYNDEGVYPR
jgi:uroporphyrinogen decarboxylase